MSENKSPDESETILIALDQISQTIEVMTRVVNRLRHHVENQADTSSDTESTQKSDNPTLH